MLIPSLLERKKESKKKTTRNKNSFYFPCFKNSFEWSHSYFTSRFWLKNIVDKFLFALHSSYSSVWSAAGYAEFLSSFYFIFCVVRVESWIKTSAMVYEETFNNEHSAHLLLCIFFRRKKKKKENIQLSFIWEGCWRIVNMFHVNCI